MDNVYIEIEIVMRLEEIEGTLSSYKGNIF